MLLENEKSLFVIVTTFDEYVKYKKVITSCGFRDVEALAIYNIHRGAERNSVFDNNVGVAAVGYYPNAAAFKNYNIKHRENCIYVGRPKKFDDVDMPLSQQSSGQVADFFAMNLLKPGATALVLFAGLGSDALAFSYNGHPVHAFEAVEERCNTIINRYTAVRNNEGSNKEWEQEKKYIIEPTPHRKSHLGCVVQHTIKNIKRKRSEDHKLSARYKATPKDWRS